jgi:uncharacterized protein YkwD
MNRARTLFSGLFAALALTAAPAFAAPAAKAEARVAFKVGFHFEGKGYRAPTKYDEALEAEVLELVNEVRARYGLPELRADARGTRAARAAAAEASREGGFRRIDTTVEARLRDQGVAAGYEMAELTQTIKESKLEIEARKIVQSWLKNPRQARILLDEDLTYGGVGAVLVDGKLSVALDAFGPKPVVRPLPPHC